MNSSSKNLGSKNLLSSKIKSDNVLVKMYSLSQSSYSKVKYGTKSSYNAKYNKIHKIIVDKNKKELRSEKTEFSSFKFISKQSAHWNEGRLQRYTENFNSWRNEKKENKLTSILEDPKKKNRWLNNKSKQKYYRDRFIQKVANKPLDTNKDKFKDTFREIRDGEDEKARSTTDKIHNSTLKPAYKMTKRGVRFIERKLNYKHHRKTNLEKIERKTDRFIKTNRFNKQLVRDLDKKRFKGVSRFKTKRKEKKIFRKANRFTLRARFIDKLKRDMRNFLFNVKNPTRLVSSLVRVLFTVKNALLVVIPLIIIMGIFGSIGISAKGNSVNPPELLIEQDAIFGKLHTKYNTVTYTNDVRIRYPGYNSYYVDTSEAEYDHYELLAYLNMRYGNIEENKEEMLQVIEDDLNDLIDELYYEELEVREEKEIVLEVQAPVNGNTRTIEKEVIKRVLKVTLKKRDFKSIAVSRVENNLDDNWFLNDKEVTRLDIEEWFDALVKNKLGEPDLEFKDFSSTVNKTNLVVTKTDGAIFDEDYIVTQPFGYTSFSTSSGYYGSTGGLHTGIDLVPVRYRDFEAEDVPIHTISDGVVITSSYHPINGNYVEIRMSESEVAYYGHLKYNTVKVGDKVNKGDTIGVLGTTGASTGYHLHFEVKRNWPWLSDTDSSIYLGVERLNAGDVLKGRKSGN